jgi:Fe-S cluster assembly iron-binding protein IscA
MIVVTDQARAELKKLLSDNGAEEGALLRLTANEEGQLGLVIDSEQAGDDTVEHEGAKVFAIESKLSGHLNGVTLDVEDTPEGPMLMLRQEGCGGGSCCGSSAGREQSCCGDEGKSCCG